MSAPPDHHELQLQARLRARIDGPPAGTPSRPRDWLDDLFDDQPAPAVTPPAPPARPPVTATRDDPPGEPRWDWRRLLHWPYARLCCGAATALIPWYHGQSAATGWGTVLRSYRTGASVGAAWIVAGIGLAVAAVLVHQRRWYGWLLLTPALVGTIAMASPLDIARLMTGAF